MHILVGRPVEAKLFQSRLVVVVEQKGRAVLACCMLETVPGRDTESISLIPLEYGVLNIVVSTADDCLPRPFDNEEDIVARLLPQWT